MAAALAAVPCGESAGAPAPQVRREGRPSERGPCGEWVQRCGEAYWVSLSPDGGYRAGRLGDPVATYHGCWAVEDGVLVIHERQDGCAFWYEYRGAWDGRRWVSTGGRAFVMERP